MKSTCKSIYIHDFNVLHIVGLNKCWLSVISISLSFLFPDMWVQRIVSSWKLDTSRALLDEEVTCPVRIQPDTCLYVCFYIAQTIQCHFLYLWEHDIVQLFLYYEIKFLPFISYSSFHKYNFYLKRLNNL